MGVIRLKLIYVLFFALIISPAVLPFVEATFPLPATGQWLSPVVIGDYVYLLFNGHSIRAFNINTGVEDPGRTISISGLSGFPLGLVYIDNLVFVMTDNNNVYALTLSGNRIESRDFTLNADDNVGLFTSSTHIYSLVEVSSVPTHFKAYSIYGTRAPVFDLTYPSVGYALTTTMLDNFLVYTNDLVPSTTPYTVNILDVNTITGYRSITIPSEAANTKAGFIFFDGPDLFALDNSASPNVIYDYVVPEQIDAVTALTSSSDSPNEIALRWTPPYYFPPDIFSGYQVNYTSPFGNPLTCLTPPGRVACSGTGDARTSTTVNNLEINFDYSFRVSVISQTGQTNATGTITNTTTLSNITPGNLNVTGTNTDRVPFIWNREEIGDITTVTLLFDRTMQLECYYDTKLNRAKANLPINPGPSNPADNCPGCSKTQFQFLNATNDIVTIHCKDTLNPNLESKYLIPQQTFLLQEQIQKFRAGEYGTDGSFGALDMVSLVVVILAMIGFNRANEGIGLIMSMVIIGLMTLLGIFSLTSLYIPLIAIGLMLGIAQMRK